MLFFRYRVFSVNFFLKERNIYFIILTIYKKLSFTAHGENATETWYLPNFRVNLETKLWSEIT